MDHEEQLVWSSSDSLQCSSVCRRDSLNASNDEYSTTTPSCLRGVHTDMSMSGLYRPEYCAEGGQTKFKHRG